MRHRIFGKQLSRTTAHRKSLRRNMAASLIEHETVRTTEAKAKELRPFVEKLITLAKIGTLHARRQVITAMPDRSMFDAEGGLLDKTVVQKLFDELAPRYADRPGGYTRIIRLSERRIGDGGVQVLLQLIEADSAQAGGKPADQSRRKRRAGRRREAASASAARAEQPARGSEPGEQKAEENQIGESPGKDTDEQDAAEGRDS